MYTTIGFEQREHIGVLTLRRPGQRNAMNPLMRDELVDLGATLGRSTSLHCLVVRGAGPSFCAGIDLHEGLGELLVQWSQQLEGDELVDAGMELAGAFEWIPTLDVPSVAAVHGYAYGAGCQLALACDFRVMTRSARMGLIETSLGLIPDMGATFRLPRLVGDGVARRMILLGDVLDGPEASDVGLADVLADDDDLDAAVDRLAARVAAQPRVAMRGARRAMAAAQDLSDAEALRLAVTEQATCLKSDEFHTLTSQVR